MVRTFVLVAAVLAACSGARTPAAQTASTSPLYAKLFERGARWTFDVVQVTTAVRPPGPPTSQPRSPVTCSVERVRTIGRARVAYVTCTGAEDLATGMHPPAGIYAASERGLWWFDVSDEARAIRAADTGLEAREMIVSANAPARHVDWVQRRHGELEHFDIIDEVRGDARCATYTASVPDSPPNLAGYELCLRGGALASIVFFYGSFTRYELRYTAR